MNARQGDLPRLLISVLCIGGLIAATFLVVRPFLAAIVWATTLVIATWPLMLQVQSLVGGRRWAAVTLMTLGLLVIVLLPLSMAIGAIITHSDRLAAFAVAAPNFRLPPPPLWLADIPMIGTPATNRWHEIAAWGAGDFARLVEPDVSVIGHWFVQAAGSVGSVFIHLLMTIAIAAVLYSAGETAAAWCRRFGRRLAGARGEGAIVLAGQAIRSVALGVVVTAVAQSCVAGLGLLIADVPRAGILSAVILLLCIAQLGPILVLAPAVIWLFATGATGSGIVLSGFTAVALVMDNFLRPFLIKRGADLPLLLVLAGVIGGLLSFGLLGLFLGPVVLAVSYTLLESWIAEDTAKAAS